MSTNPIIVAIVDQVDPNIQAKINGIGASARDAAVQVGNLTAALAGLSGVQASNINNLGSALAKISTASVAAAPNVVNLSKSLGQVTVAATQTVAAGTTLVDAINLIKPAAAISEAALLNMAFALRNVSNGAATIPSLATAVNLIPPVARQANAALVGMASALVGVNSGATLAQRAGTSLASAWQLLPPVAQQSNSQLLNMAFALKAVQPAAAAATAASNTFGNAVVNLISRIGFASVGLGRFGGAFGSVATKLISSGPLIIAGLALLTLAGAILLYEKFRAEANQLADTQASLGKELGAASDKLLQQKERLVELTQGPMARYAQALKDIRFESDSIDFSNILRELEEQHSWWQRIDAAVENVVANAIKYGSLKFASPANTGTLFDVRDTELFIRQEEAKRQAGLLQTQVTKQGLQEIIAASKTAAEQITFDRKTQLEREIIDFKNKIQIENAALSDQVGSRAEIENKSLNGLRQTLNRLLVEYQSYLNKRNELGAEADKAAAAEQLKLFNEERDRLKAGALPGEVTTAQDELRLRQQQLAGVQRPTAVPGLDSLAAKTGPLGGNIRVLNDEITKLNIEIGKQAFVIKNTIDKYEDGVAKAGAYNDALKAQADTEKILLTLRQARIPVDDALKASIEGMTLRAQAQLRIGREEITIYNEFRAPLEAYNATLSATNKLLDKNVISQNEAQIVYNKAARVYKDAIDPLNEYNISLQSQIGLLNDYGDALRVNTQIEELNQSLKKQGRDALSAEQTTILKQQLTDMERQRQVQSDLNELWEKSVGAQQKNIDQQKALNRALQDGIISLEQYKNGSIAVALAQIELQNAQGKGGLKSNVVQIFGSMVDLSKTTVQKMNLIWQGFFGTLKKGFADSLAHALVFGGSLKQGLLDVARNAVSALISSLIQLGIELLIIDGLSHIPGVKKLFDMMKQGHQDAKEQAVQLGLAIASILAITAVQLAAISSLMGPAWSLAEAVSLFSFGANAAPAAAGIAAVVAAGSVAQGVGKFAGGGLVSGPGGPTADKVPVMASSGEFIVNAAQTSKHYDLLKALNDGRIDFTSLTTARFAQGGYVSNTQFTSGADAVKSNAMHVSTNVQMKINVVHDGSTNVQVEQIDATTVRIIAQREAKEAVQQFAPGVIATDLHNPNSRTSKAVNQTVVAPRRR